MHSDLRCNFENGATITSYSRHHPEDVETLFLLLRAFLERHLSTNHRLYAYLDVTVATTYTIPQKRAVFFKFVEIFSGTDYSQEHKAKVCALSVRDSKITLPQMGEGGTTSLFTVLTQHRIVV